MEFLGYGQLIVLLCDTVKYKPLIDMIILDKIWRDNYNKYIIDA